MVGEYAKITLRNIHFYVKRRLPQNCWMNRLLKD